MKIYQNLIEFMELYNYRNMDRSKPRKKNTPAFLSTLGTSVLSRKKLSHLLLLLTSFYFAGKLSKLVRGKASHSYWIDYTFRVKT